MFGPINNYELKLDNLFDFQISSIGKRLDRKYSGQGFDAPPSYEDAVGATRSPYSER